MILEYSENVTQGLEKYLKESREGTEKALRVVGMRIVQDAVTKPPTVPIKTGFLRGSWSVYVNRKRSGGTQGPSNGDSDGLIVAFNTPYAAARHEEGWQPGEVSERANAGPKWLSSKLETYLSDYMRLFADKFKEFVG